MKIETLLEKMKHLGVKLPSIGTGLNGRILARDLEKVLGDYYFERKYPADSIVGRHCQMRRSIVPMKAYRYNKLKSVEQYVALEQDNNQWIAEEKFNGWRIVITFIPGDKLRFWSGNISDVDFLPTDYTKHVVLDNPGRVCKGKEAFALDSEAICLEQVETLEGLLSTNTLDAVGAILGSNSDRAKTLQQGGAKLLFMCFDCILFSDPIDEQFTSRPLSFTYSLEARRYHLKNITAELLTTTIRVVDQHCVNKKRFLNLIWKQGKEGVVLKNIDKGYVSGGRLKTHAIKVKRSMSGEIGDNIDAFISGFINTPEHSKRNVIGGLELSVYTKEDREHHIATVTGIPEDMRLELTANKLEDGSLILDPAFMGKVVIVDGQELSNKHRKLMHAKIDWHAGFRKDKTKFDCVLDIADLNEERF